MVFIISQSLSHVCVFATFFFPEQASYVVLLVFCALMMLGDMIKIAELLTSSFVEDKLKDDAISPEDVQKAKLLFWVGTAFFSLLYAVVFIMIILAMLL